MNREHIIQLFDNRFTLNAIYHRRDILTFLESITFSIANPVALTYNQWNIGMPFIMPLFVKDGSKFTYLGTHAKYSGETYHAPRGGVRELIGVWLNGHFEYAQDGIDNFNDWKHYTRGKKGKEALQSEPSMKLVVSPKSLSVAAQELTQKHGFKPAGRFNMVNNKPNLESYVQSRTERISLVYAFIVDDSIKYLGKTIQGYSRPFNYIKNTVMKDVQSGILETLNNGGFVDILVKTENLSHKLDDLALDLCESYEQALITKYKPAWNNHIRLN
jgi:hypothetical protein